MGSFFLNSALAWATLALVSIPIIIHLIHRRRVRRIEWAAMEFLLRALKRNRRRIRLEQLILLLLRIAMMALLGFALARPILSGSSFSWLGSAFRSEEKTFVLDDSFSTTCAIGGRTVFEREVEALASALDHLVDEGGSDRASVLRSSAPRAPLVRRVPLDDEGSAALARRLATFSPNDTRLHLADVLEALAEDRAGVEDALSRPLAVTVLSDLRAADWTDGAGGADPRLAAALARLSADEETPARLVVVDVAKEVRGNVALTGVEQRGPAVAGVPTEFAVSVRNFGDAPARGLQLALRYAEVREDEWSWADVNGPALAALEPGETRTAAVFIRFREAGPHAVDVEVRGADDALPTDDRYAVAVDVVESVKILLVSGEPSSERFEGETDVLEMALAPSGDETSGVRPDVVVEESLSQVRLDEYTSVFLCNLFALPEDFLARLNEFVRGGGSAIVFLGDQVDGDLYNRVLGGGASAGETNASEAEASSERESDARFLPARVGEIVDATQDPVHFAPDLSHPYFRSLREVGEAFQHVDVMSYFALEPTVSAQVLARFSDPRGSPAIVEHAFGEGRVILAATSADFEWSDWPRSPTYLILVQDLVATLARTGVVTTERRVGAPLAIPVDIARYERQARVRPPGYPAVPERTLNASPAAPGASEFQFVVPGTTRAGHYSFALRTKEGEEEWRVFALTRAAEESDLTRVSSEALERLYPGVDLSVVSGASTLASVGRGRFEIADLLLAFLVLVLFVEAFLAWKFAHHRDSTSGNAPRAKGGVR